MPAMKAAARFAISAFILATAFVPPLCAQGSSQNQSPEIDAVKQGMQMERDGKLNDALALYENSLKTMPKSYALNLATGGVLDLLGRNGEARDYFEKAVASADSPQYKAMAQRSIAMSYAFQADCKQAAAAEEDVFNYYVSTGDFYQQGEMSDEAARVCLDAGDFDAAEKLYRRGRDVGMQEKDIKPARVDLWNFRWENAEARLAARRGNHDEAEKHVAAAKAILDKGTNPEQAPFMPALVGYVDFYGGDYEAALEQFQQANQRDAFIQCMMAQSYEKLGQKDKAIEFYQKAGGALSHNPPAAYAVPLSKKRLAELQN